MSNCADPRGLVSWDENIPDSLTKYGKPGLVFPEERVWHISERDNELEPCCFCGSDGIVEAFEERCDEEADRRQHWSGHVMYRVVCMWCAASGPSCGPLDEAIQKWNAPFNILITRKKEAA
jgi:hypothetical protein